MKLLVLAGGFGTRLQSVVSSVPKVLAPVLGKPFLHYQIEHWRSQGVHSFAFLLHHQHSQIIDFIEARKQDLLHECLVEHVIEATPLGTGGAVANAVRHLKIDGDFLLTNADTWLGQSVEKIGFARAPAIGVLEVENVGRYGQVQISPKGLVTSFSEKSACTQPGWINAGMAKLNAEYFFDWQGLTYSLESQLLPRLAAEGLLSAVPLSGNFIDIGIPADYARFCHWIETNKAGKL